MGATNHQAIASIARDAAGARPNGSATTAGTRAPRRVTAKSQGGPAGSLSVARSMLAPSSMARPAAPVRACLRYDARLRMRRRAYPLEPLARVREEKVDAGTRRLAKAVSEREAADARRASAEQERLAPRGEGERDRRGGARGARGGSLRAADLAQGQAWEARVAAEQQALADVEQRAAGAAGDAAEVERGARQELAAREAEANVVERDRARWAGQERQREERAEEEAAAEAFRPRR